MLKQEEKYWFRTSALEMVKGGNGDRFRANTFNGRPKTQW